MTAPIDFNFNRRPCPKCGEGCSVTTVQNDWNRGIPIRYRAKRWIRRKISCTNIACAHFYWTIELPEVEFDLIANDKPASECLVEG
jgi:hypothetical protein